MTNNSEPTMGHSELTPNEQVALLKTNAVEYWLRKVATLGKRKNPMKRLSKGEARSLEDVEYVLDQFPIDSQLQAQVTSLRVGIQNTLTSVLPSLAGGINNQTESAFAEIYSYFFARFYLCLQQAESLLAGAESTGQQSDLALTALSTVVQYGENQNKSSSKGSLKHQILDVVSSRISKSTGFLQEVATAVVKRWDELKRYAEEHPNSMVQLVERAQGKSETSSSASEEGVTKEVRILECIVKELECQYDPSAWSDPLSHIEKIADNAQLFIVDSHIQPNTDSHSYHFHQEILMQLAEQGFKHWVFALHPEATPFPFSIDEFNDLREDFSYEENRRLLEEYLNTELHVSLKHWLRIPEEKVDAVDVQKQLLYWENIKRMAAQNIQMHICSHTNNPKAGTQKVVDRLLKKKKRVLLLDSTGTSYVADTDQYNTKLIKHLCAHNDSSDPGDGRLALAGYEFSQTHFFGNPHYSSLILSSEYLREYYGVGTMGDNLMDAIVYSKWKEKNEGDTAKAYSPRDETGQPFFEKPSDFSRKLTTI